MTAGTLLLLFLPFLVSLAGQPGTPKVLCLVSSILAMLLSVREFGAVLAVVPRYGGRRDFGSGEISSLLAGVANCSPSFWDSPQR